MESIMIDLHGLPLETLQQIACYLADSHRPSLSSFALASRICYNAATPSIFSRIRLVIHSREQLQRDVDAVVQTLSRTDSARHVHYLSLEGFLDLKRPTKNSETNDGSSNSWWSTTQIDETIIDIIPRVKERIPIGRYTIQDEPIIEQSSDEDIAWAPVIAFIKTLPSLAKMVYNCPNQFPPSLLHTLHKHHPYCKLHHLTFRLRSLLRPTPCSYEMALATSPCLYKVKIFCSWRDSDGFDDFNQEMVMELAAGLAPNLKEVIMVKFTADHSPRYTYRRDRWQGLPGFSLSKKTGYLTSLSLVGVVRLRPPYLIQAWAQFIDFSFLHHLSLGGTYDRGISGEIMEYIAQNYSFPQLKSLRLVIQRDDNQIEKPDYTDNAIRFFTKFEPLEELSVSGPLEPQIVNAILRQHGPTLKKLHLRPVEITSQGYGPRIRREIPMVFHREYILKLQLQCPGLKELAIPIKRMRSSAIEVDMYRAFTKMENLQSLFLILDCSDWRPFRDTTYNPLLDPEFDEHDREMWYSKYLRKGHLRLALMNCAVDETLARSIWELIFNNKVGKKLESLKLWTTGAGTFGDGHDGAMASFSASMSRSWLIERLPRDDKNIIKIKELGQHARETLDQDYREDTTERNRFRKMRNYEESLTPEQRKAELAMYGELKRPADLDLDYGWNNDVEMEVFTRLWPHKNGSKNWREDWSSIPLEV